MQLNQGSPWSRNSITIDGSSPANGAEAGPLSSTLTPGITTIYPQGRPIRWTGSCHYQPSCAFCSVQTALPNEVVQEASPGPQLQASDWNQVRVSITMYPSEGTAAISVPLEGVQKSGAENHLLEGSNFVSDSPLPSFRPNEVFWSNLLILVGGRGRVWDVST